MCVPYRERPLEAPHGATGPVTCDKSASLRPAKPARLPWLLHDDAAAVFSLLRFFGPLFLSQSIYLLISLTPPFWPQHDTGRSRSALSAATLPILLQNTQKKVLQAVVFHSIFPPLLFWFLLPSVPRYSFLGFFGKQPLQPFPTTTRLLEWQLKTVMLLQSLINTLFLESGFAFFLSFFLSF